MNLQSEVAIERISEEMRDQAALELHKWNQKATVVEIYESRASSYERITRIIAETTGKPHRMQPWWAAKFAEDVFGS
jgi:shikimate kinase